MEIKVEPNDYQSMENFHLKWRWTDATWNLLPQTDLAQIKPLKSAKARELHEYSLSLLGCWKLNAELFSDISDIDDRNTDSPETVQTWLEQRGVEHTTPIVVSWDNETAVITNWGIFCNYWDEFCYPLSNDVVVWPEDRNWALLYFHEEIISFGHRAT